MRCGAALEPGPQMRSLRNQAYYHIYNRKMSIVQTTITFLLILLNFNAISKTVKIFLFLSLIVFLQVIIFKIENYR